MSDLILEDLQCKGLMIYQSVNGYRFTSDAVALANYVKVKSGGNLVDLCSGSGVIGILANAKNNIGKVVLVELQKSLADMSQRTIEYNGLGNVTVINDRLQGVHRQIGMHVDTVVCNPPYYKATDKGRCDNKEILLARNEVEVTLPEIILEASKILKDGGKFYMCIKEDRLVDVLCDMRAHRLEPKEIKVLDAKNHKVVLIKAIKEGEKGLNIILEK